MTLTRGTGTGTGAAAGGSAERREGGVLVTRGRTSGEAGAEPDNESGGEGATLRLDLCTAAAAAIKGQAV